MPAQVKRKPGRPSKQEILRRERAALREERKVKEEMVRSLKGFYKCTRCGLVVENPGQKFYTVNANTLFRGNDGKTSICIDCANEIFSEHTKIFEGNRKVAMLLTCLSIGCYFSESLFDYLDQAEKEDPKGKPLSVGRYLRCLNGVQYKDKSFMNFVLEIVDMKGRGMSAECADMRNLHEDKWRKKDQVNKAQCLRMVGYDPFDDDSYTFEDRRQLYNSLACYLIMPEVAEDKHKLDSAIEIVKTNLQITWLDKEMNREMRSGVPDLGKVGKLSDTKTALSRAVNQIAKENGISLSSGNKSQNTLALTSIMKEMMDQNVMEAKPNLISVKMTDVFENISKINAKALMEELAFTGDEYAEMVSHQADTIRSLNEELTRVKEELRTTTIALHEKEKPIHQRRVTYRVNLNPDEAEEDEEIVAIVEGSLVEHDTGEEVSAGVSDDHHTGSDGDITA